MKGCLSRAGENLNPITGSFWSFKQLRLQIKLGVTRRLFNSLPQIKKINTD